MNVMKKKKFFNISSTIDALSSFDFVSQQIRVIVEMVKS